MSGADDDVSVNAPSHAHFIVGWLAFAFASPSSSPASAGSASTARLRLRWRCCAGVCRGLLVSRVRASMRTWRLGGCWSSGDCGGRHRASDEREREQERERVRPVRLRLRLRWSNAARERRERKGQRTHYTPLTRGGRGALSDGDGSGRRTQKMAKRRASLETKSPDGRPSQDREPLVCRSPVTETEKIGARSLREIMNRQLPIEWPCLIGRS
jgi:hypothetical protein